MATERSTAIGVICSLALKWPISNGEAERSAVMLLRDQSKLRKHKMRGKRSTLYSHSNVCPCVASNVLYTPTPRKQQATISCPMHLFFWQYAGVSHVVPHTVAGEKRCVENSGTKTPKLAKSGSNNAILFLFFSLANNAILHVMSSTLQLMIFCEELQRPHHLLRGKQVGTHTSRTGITPLACPGATTKGSMVPRQHTR